MLTGEILTIMIHTGEIPTRYDTYQGDAYWKVHGNRIPTGSILTRELLTGGLATGEILTGKLCTVAIPTSRVLPMGYLLVGYIPVRDLDW